MRVARVRPQSALVDVCARHSVPTPTTPARTTERSKAVRARSMHIAVVRMARALVDVTAARSTPTPPAVARTAERS